MSDQWMIRGPISTSTTATSRVTAGVELEPSDSYGQFDLLHVDPDGVIR